MQTVVVKVPAPIQPMVLSADVRLDINSLLTDGHVNVCSFILIVYSTTLLVFSVFFNQHFASDLISTILRV